MRFESKLKRNYLINVAIATIPDIAIAIILAIVFNGGFLGFLAIYFGLQVLYFAIWTKNTVFGWAHFRLAGRKQMTKHLLDFLLENKFPDPGDQQVSVEDYFYTIVNDEALPVEMRVRATHEIATMNTYRTLGQIQQLLRINIAYEDAIEQYRTIEQYKRSRAEAHG